MKTVRKLFFVCLTSAVIILICGFGEAVCAAPYFAIDVTMGYDNQAKYGRYMPMEISVYSQEEFEGIISVHVPLADGGTQVISQPVSIAADSSRVIQTWIPLFSKNNEFLFVLKDSSGDEVRRKYETVEVIEGDYTELFVGVMSTKRVIKKLFNEINLGEYSDITYPYILTRSVSVDSSQLWGDTRYILDCLDIMFIMDDSVSSLTTTQTEALLSWVADGKTLIVEFGEHIGGKFLELYREAYAKRQEEDELRPGLWALCQDYGEGRIGFVAAYSEEMNFTFYAGSNPEMTGLILCKACPLDMINSIINYDMYYTNYDDSYAVQYMLNTAVGKTVPNITEYITLITVYIILAGPVLYIILRRIKKTNYTLLCVLCLSAAFSFIIYKMGEDTRFTDMYLQYASIVDITEGAAEENTYFCVNTPYSDTYYMRINPQYAVDPITQSEGERHSEDDYIELLHAAEDIKLTVRKTVPFSREYFKATRIPETVEDWNIDISVTYYDGILSGTVTNGSERTLEESALILYGRIILLGRIKSGEQIDISSARMVTLPYYPSDAADRITGIEGVHTGFAEKNDAVYKALSGKSGIVEYAIDKYFDEKKTTALFVGFLSDTADDFQIDAKYDSYGFTMLYKETAVNTAIGSFQYEVLDYKDIAKADNNSNYNSYSNTTYGSRVRLQYSFRDRDSLVKIVFDGEADDGMEDDYYATFEGETYFYNHSTLSYDKVDISDKNFYISELLDYLLETEDGYSLTVQYNISKPEKYRYSEIKMPSVAVVRRSVYAESAESEKELQ